MGTRNLIQGESDNWQTYSIVIVINCVLGSCITVEVLVVVQILLKSRKYSGRSGQGSAQTLISKDLSA